MQESMDSDAFNRQFRGGGDAKKHSTTAKRGPSQVTVTISLPPKQMHPNARCHWRAKLKPKAIQRQNAALAAGYASRVMFRSATIQATFHLGKRGKRHDSDNLIAWLKASIDGLQDAGVLADDSGVTWLPPAQVFGKSAGEDKMVVLTITGA
jgi:Holliday junction resolvase RusA-like endonuclease